MGQPSEYQEENGNFSRHHQPGRKLVVLGRARRLVVLVGMAGFAAWALVGHWTSWTGIWWGCKNAGIDSGARSEFQWSQVVPSRHLVYHPCFGGFECARLDVPMDWNKSGDGGARVAVAVIRLPARVPVTDHRYGGPVLINPGGPGGSGVQVVLAYGRLLQTVLDSALSPSDLASTVGDGPPKYFDIIGFDPRGVGSTTPAMSCFPDYPSRKLWYLQSQDDGLLGSSDAAYPLAWARASALGQHCSHVDGDFGENQDGLASFVNTSPVVADMVAIVERHGEWREMQAAAWLASPRGGSQSAAESKDAKYTREAVLERTAWRKGHEKLLYWGFSYGTLLGATFASMEPHRISRVVLDGVVDADDYYSAGWSTNLQDTDLLLDKFFEYCHKAGPSRCPLHTGNSPHDIRDRYKQLLNSIRRTPFPVSGSGELGPGIITYSDVKRLIFSSLYLPTSLYPYMARVLADLSNGNGTSFSECLANRRRSTDLSLSRNGEPLPIFCQVPVGDGGTSLAILCSDGESLRHETPDSFKGYWEQLQKQSTVLGNEWAVIRLGCVAWDTRPKWRYAGESS